MSMCRCVYVYAYRWNMAQASIPDFSCQENGRTDLYEEEGIMLLLNISEVSKEPLRDIVKLWHWSVISDLWVLIKPWVLPNTGTGFDREIKFFGSVISATPEASIFTTSTDKPSWMNATLHGICLEWNLISRLRCLQFRITNYYFTWCLSFKKKKRKKNMMSH